MTKYQNRPNPDQAFPNPNLPRLCFIKNVVKNPRIIIGDYTYYDDVDGAEQFEKHVTHFYDFIGDRLIIGKFCAIAKGIEFVMNGANHRMNGVTTYGAIIGTNSVVASDIPPYAVAVGNPCRVVRMRFDDEFIAFLLQLKWWDWDIEKIEVNFEALSSGDLSLIRNL